MLLRLLLRRLRERVGPFVGGLGLKVLFVLVFGAESALGKASLGLSQRGEKRLGLRSRADVARELQRQWIVSVRRAEK